MSYSVSVGVELVEVFVLLCYVWTGLLDRRRLLSYPLIYQQPASSESACALQPHLHTRFVTPYPTLSHFSSRLTLSSCVSARAI